MLISILTNKSPTSGKSFAKDKVSQAKKLRCGTDGHASVISYPYTGMGNHTVAYGSTRTSPSASGRRKNFADPVTNWKSGFRSGLRNWKKRMKHCGNYPQDSSQPKKKKERGLPERFMIRSELA